MAQEDDKLGEALAALGLEKIIASLAEDIKNRVVVDVDASTYIALALLEELRFVRQVLISLDGSIDRLNDSTDVIRRNS